MAWSIHMYTNANKQQQQQHGPGLSEASFFEESLHICQVCRCSLSHVIHTANQKWDSPVRTRSYILLIRANKIYFDASESVHAHLSETGTDAYALTFTHYMRVLHACPHSRHTYASTSTFMSRIHVYTHIHDIHPGPRRVSTFTSTFMTFIKATWILRSRDKITLKAARIPSMTNTTSWHSRTVTLLTGPLHA
jgi:hypothetical protein